MPPADGEPHSLIANPDQTSLRCYREAEPTLAITPSLFGDVSDS